MNEFADKEKTVKEGCLNNSWSFCISISFCLSNKKFIIKNETRITLFKL